MATQYQFIKRYENFYGVDYKSSDLKFPENTATELRNIAFSQIGSIEKRKGYQPVTASVGGCGLHSYRRYDSNGVEILETISVDNNIWKLVETTVAVNYSGSASNSEVSVFFDAATSQYRCQIQEGTSQVLNYALGLGVDVGSPVTVANLITQINALAGWTATATGATTMPAAFIEAVIDWDISQKGLLTLRALAWSQVNAPITLLPGNSTYKNSEEFENTTSVQLQNCLYLANGYDEIVKYDGQNAYRAGMPEPASFQYSIANFAGGVHGDNFSYKVQYLQKDAQGNETVGNYVEPLNSATLTKYWSNSNDQRVTMTVPNIVAASGFNTNCAVVAGAQTSVTTLTVDNGAGGAHTLKVGDTAYFYDSVSADYIEREVTNATANTITIAGAAVTVADNAVISNNLRIVLWRSKSTGSATLFPTVWYALDEIPNNSFAATQTYFDTKQDSALGAIFIEPATDRSPPVKGRYISAFQNLMVTAGNLDNVNTLSISDVENPEYFPVPEQQFVVADIFGDKITGISPSNELFVVFQRRGIHVVSGEIATGAFRVDQIANDVGCAAHASIKDIRGSLMFMSNAGPRMLTGGQIPQGLGRYEQNPYISRIDPLFDQFDEIDSTKVYQLRRSTAIHDRVNQRYVCFVPCESVTTGQRYANENSVTFVYDYQRDSWLEWDKMNMAGGISQFGNQLLFTERRFSTTTSTVRNHTYKVYNTGTRYDYQDHDQPISAKWASPWDFMGEASLLKSFLAIRIFSTEEVENLFTITLKTEVDWIKDTETLISIPVGAGGYGLDAWDTSAWGSPADPTLTKKLNNNRRKAIRIIFENAEAQSNYSIAGYELEVAANYKPRFVQ